MAEESTPNQARPRAKHGSKATARKMINHKVKRVDARSPGASLSATHAKAVNSKPCQMLEISSSAGLVEMNCRNSIASMGLLTPPAGSHLLDAATLQGSHPRPPKAITSAFPVSCQRIGSAPGVPPSCQPLLPGPPVHRRRRGLPCDAGHSLFAPKSSLS